MKQDVVRRMLVKSGARQRAFGEFADRGLDLVVALAAVLVFAPVFLAVGTALALEGRGPVLFAHERIGRGGARFRVFKFRTMHLDGDRLLQEHLVANAEALAEWSSTQKLRSDPRVTLIGKFLRRSSLDELPQLLNVLRGEMSMVGPRPIVQAEAERYGRFFDLYCSVRPGITGVWQVSGNDVSYQRRVEMDALYARRKSVLLDVRVMIATIPAVLRARGSY